MMEISSTDSDALEIFHQHCPAKLNIFLHINGKRMDGYHLLTSLAAFTDFGDKMRISYAHKPALHLTGPYAPALAQAGGEAIIQKLTAALSRAGVSLPALNIEIEKNIPLGGGLGGGSADGAGYLKCLMKMGLLDLPDAEIMDIAAAIGADIPVCMHGGLQLMQGKGEILTPVNPPSQMPYCVLANPQEHVSTAQIFSALTQTHPSASPAATEIQQISDAGEWQELIQLGNHLTAPATEFVPQIAKLLQEMKDFGDTELSGSFYGAAMSGSGASCFALCAHKTDSDHLCAYLNEKGYWAVSTFLTKM